MALGRLMADAISMAVKSHDHSISKTLSGHKPIRAGKRRASLWNKNPHKAGPIVYGEEGVRHTSQLNIINLCGYGGLVGHTSVSTRSSTHVIVTAQIHWGVELGLYLVCPHHVVDDRLFRLSALLNAPLVLFRASKNLTTIFVSQRHYLLATF